MNIAFITTSSGISGGHNVIFEHAYNLQNMGHQVDIIGRSLDQFQFAYKWHDRANKLSFRTITETPRLNNYDIVIATNFHSVFLLPMISSRSYCFFMQAKEADFIPDDNIILKNWLLSILDLNLPTIVCANWIKTYLHNTFKRDSFVCLNGIRKDLYRLDLTDQIYPNKQVRLLVEGAIEAPHKNVLKTIALCLRSKAKSIGLLTPSTNTECIPKEVSIHKSIPLKELAEIYSSYDILVKLSTTEGMFGPPLEMFHCGGTAITYNVPGHEEYLINDVNSLVVPMEDEKSALEGINNLLEDHLLLGRLKNGAKKTAEKWADWEVSSKRFEEGLIWASNSAQMTRDKLSQAIQISTNKYLREKWRSKKKITPPIFLSDEIA